MSDAEESFYSATISETRKRTEQQRKKPDLKNSPHKTTQHGKQVRIHKEYLELEPIGILFLAAFASLLFIQFIAMLIHRLKTFAQIVANTDIILFDKSVEKLTEEQIMEMNSVDSIKKLQKLKGADDSDDEDDAFLNAPPDRRPTVFRLQRNAQKRQHATNDLEEAFKRRMAFINNYTGLLPRKTVEVIQRRKTVVENRRPMNAQRAPVIHNQGRRNIGFVDDEFNSFA